MALLFLLYMIERSVGMTKTFEQNEQRIEQDILALFDDY